MPHRDVRVDGMDCPSCATPIEAALRKIDAVKDVSVNVLAGTVRISFDGELQHRAVVNAIRKAGYSVPTHPGNEERTAFWSRRGRSIVTAASGTALLLGLALSYAGFSRLLVEAVLAVGTIAGAWYVAPRGVRAAISGSLDMNALMTIAATGAWIIGDHAEAAATMFLFAVAELLEGYSTDRARNAIRALMELSPLEARVVRDGRECLVGVDQVAVGESVLVRPGEKLPVDGVVIEGRSCINQAPITGESMPVDKEPGSEVFAGTLNSQGALTIRSGKPANDSTIARIIHAVEEAQGSRSPSQRFVDRFARIYTPVVVAVAVLVAVVPPLLGLGGWEAWIYRALTMLVVACPCALVISTPISIVSGLASAARAGILIKGGAHLEQLGKMRVVAFDKTGTLTEGHPAVTEVIALSDLRADEVLLRAITVERHSEHPLARAMVSYGAAKQLTPNRSTDFMALPGRGATAVTGDSMIHVGNARLAAELEALPERTLDLVRRFEGQGKTAVIVIEQLGSGPARAIGIIAMADRPRLETRKALDALRDLGITRILMLTGDNAGTASAIGREIGADEIHANLLPEDKVRIIREIESSGHRVAFVGDGVNDAPALAAATVGIAMGAAGSDVALETADVGLMGDDLMNLARAVKISRKTVAIVKENVGFAVAVKALFLILAMTGLATLWMAVGADMGASLIVIANGLRARRG